MTHSIILYKSNISLSFLHDQQEPLKVNNKVILIRSDKFQENALLLTFHFSVIRIIKCIILAPFHYRHIL